MEDAVLLESGQAFLCWSWDAAKRDSRQAGYYSDYNRQLSRISHIAAKASSCAAQLRPPPQSSPHRAF